ncbi:PAS-domain containing protein [Acetobacteraceae bacterium H6797]|nr:PAS-domain containing protein [Acetobacteraceae bacterium H6797]
MPREDADGDAYLAGAFKALNLLLLVYDREHRLAYVSPAVLAHLDLPATALPLGTSLEQVVRLLAYRGFYGSGDPEKLVRDALSIDLSRPLRRVVIDTKGTYLDLENEPLPDGGFVARAIIITPYMAAARAAEARAAALTDMVQRVECGAALYDEKRCLVMRNAAHDRLIGLPPGAVQAGMSFDDLLHLLRVRGEFALEPGMLDDIFARDFQSAPQRLVYRRPNGMTIQVRSQPVAGGGFQIELLDITTATEVENEARRRAGLVDAVLDALPVGVCVYDAEMRVAKVNRALYDIMAGATIEIGEKLDDLLLRRQREGEFDTQAIADIRAGHDEAAMAGGRGVTLRTRPNGTVLSISRARLPDGGHVAVVSDVTALQQAETEARERAETLQVLLDSLRQGICLLDKDGRLIIGNAPARVMSGLGDAMVPGKTLQELGEEQLSRGEIDDRMKEIIRASFAAERSFFENYTRTRPDGTILEVRTRKVPGGMLRVFEDVTEERRIRRELEEAKDAAEEASHAKSRFLATMSHELRTPLNAVIGFSEALRHEVGESGPSAEYAAAIEEAGRRLLSMIDSILEVSGTERGIPPGRDAFDLASALRVMLRGVAAEAEAKHVTTSTALPTQPIRLLLDARRFHRMIEALLSNAVKFTEPGGKVTIAARALEGGGLALDVSDTGIGIAEKDIPRAFEPFTQLDTGNARHHAGTGMGLYVARTLAVAMGCAMSMQSEPGKGTTVTLTIPAASLVTPREGAST